MKKHWMFVFLLVAVTAGCNQERAAEDTARDAAQDAKVAEAVKTQKRGAMSKPEETPMKPADNPQPAGETGESNKADNGNSEKSEAAAKPAARDVLNEAIAKAKASDKSLFVHFTADW